MNKARLFFTVILPPIDLVFLFCAGLAAYFLRTSSWVAQRWPVYFHLNLPFGSYLVLIAGVSASLLFVFALVGLYEMKPRRAFLKDFPKIVIGVSASIFALVFYIFLRREWFNSRFLVLAGWAFAIIFVSFGRLLIACLRKFLMRKYHYGLRRVLIIGGDDVSERAAQDIEKYPELGYLLVRRVLTPNLKFVKKLLKKRACDEVILTDPNWPKTKITGLIRFCERKHLVFKFVPNLFQTLTLNSEAGTLGAVPVIEVKRAALAGWWSIFKRVFDIVFSLIFIVIFSPLYLLIALLIKLDSPGPVIYKDYRHGCKKRKFVFYKFRSMKTDLCDGEFGTRAGNEMLKRLERDASRNLRKGGPLHKIEGDPRRTKIGSFIRKYSLDELPQFFNVLKGDMSVVGYRPHMSKEVEKYTEEQEKMFCAKPGITGLAQISGRSDLDFNEEVRLDLFYIENWSFFLDIIIILKTPFALFKKHQE